jgi:hypothetical protein
MVAECTYIYESGHKCRRIPRRGQPLCPGHSLDAHRLDAEAATERQLTLYIRHLTSLALKDLLPTTLDALTQIQPIIDSKSSRFHRAAFDRARHALALSIDRLDQFFQNSAARPVVATGSARPPAPVPAPLALPPLSDVALVPPPFAKDPKFVAALQLLQSGQKLSHRQIDQIIDDIDEVIAPYCDDDDDDVDDDD